MNSYLMDEVNEHAKKAKGLSFRMSLVAINGISITEDIFIQDGGDYYIFIGGQLSQQWIPARKGELLILQKLLNKKFPPLEE